MIFQFSFSIRRFAVKIPIPDRGCTAITILGTEYLKKLRRLILQLCFCIKAYNAAISDKEDTFHK